MDDTPIAPAAKAASAIRHEKASVPERPRPDDMFQSLADDIVDGRRMPGEKLDERELARKFAVSRTPVREALAQLAASGLAIKEPNRGVFVRKIPLDQLAQLFETMAEIESVCARLSAERMTAAERGALERFHASSAGCVRTGSVPAYEKTNRQFHSMIYDGTHNPVLIALVRDVRRRASPFRRAQFHVLGRLASSHEEHGRIVAAICRGDGDTAYQAMRDHLLIVSDASAEYLTGQPAAHGRHAD